MKYLIQLITMALITGCASTYVPPSSGPTAKVVFPVIKNSYSMLGGASSYGARFAVEKENGCGRFSRNILPDIKGGNIATSVVPANKNLFVQILYGSGYSTCNIVGFFKPEEGETYSILDVSSSNKCGIAVINSNKKPIELSRAKADTMTGFNVCPI